MSRPKPRIVLFGACYFALEQTGPIDHTDVRRSFYSSADLFDLSAFTVSQAAASETDGIEVRKRVVERPAESTIREELQIDLSDFKPGVYTVYITVRDLVTGELNSRFLTLQLD